MFGCAAYAHQSIGKLELRSKKCALLGYAEDTTGYRFWERGHVCGLGRVLKDTSPSLDSTAASKVPQGTAHQFSRDSQNNDYRFTMYEAQLRRMQRKIEHLKNSIPVVVPEEDNNEDANKGLRDL
ncbi:hypothetical protein Adt_34816 [Abeliophyllum distichum]|uniref:Retroviral polymerase SH3-like domain-containing protein n=1 Tax=Abeliophyllum distichum TaxID=126358 RepID=A0ABD1R071_9LAMI